MKIYERRRTGPGFESLRIGPWSRMKVGEITITRCLGIRIKTIGKMRVIRVWRWKHLFGKETR